AWDTVQPGDDCVPAPAELCEHRVDLVTWAGDGCESGQLDRGRRARDRVDQEASDWLYQRAREVGVAKPPAGHCKRLRETVDEYRSREEVLVPRNRAVLRV